MASKRRLSGCDVPPAPEVAYRVAFFAAKAVPALNTPSYFALGWENDRGRRCTQIIADMPYETAKEYADRLNPVLAGMRRKRERDARKQCPDNGWPLGSGHADGCGIDKDGIDRGECTCGLLASPLPTGRASAEKKFHDGIDCVDGPCVCGHCECEHTDGCGSLGCGVCACAEFKAAPAPSAPEGRSER